MKSVAHLTSVHSRDDTRIFIKQCRSLADADYSVNLVVADGKDDQFKQGVNIIDVGCLPGRLNRMSRITGRIFQVALTLDADIYHIHDPELIPTGLRLKRLNKRVIFDSHEDVPKQILSKPYLGPVRSRIFAAAYSSFERVACPRFDGIVAATPTIAEKFRSINSNVVDINNYPLLGELDAGLPWDSKRAEICYVGTISAIRGIRELISALSRSHSGARLSLVGRISDTKLADEVKSTTGWQRVNELGFRDRSGVREVLGRAMAGIVTFHPSKNHIDAQPNKMFEYMSAGIPVIASDFPLWRRILDGNKCGLCVDPLDPDAIAAAIDQVTEDPDRARTMGDNGRRAVIETYNWPVEEQKLLAFYEDIMKRPFE